MADWKETAITHVAPDDTTTFCSSENKWINRILKLHKQHPGAVKIKYLPEDNHGVLYADIPANWLKISPPRQMNYTDEQRAAMAERLAAAREKKANE